MSLTQLYLFTFPPAMDGLSLSASSPCVSCARSPSPSLPPFRVEFSVASKSPGRRG